MSSLKSTMSYNSHPDFDEDRWIIHIRRTLDEELENDCEIPVSIFSVPKSLMTSNPDCYTPQLVAIGPYHCWRPELFEMERYKLALARSNHKRTPGLKFQDIVDHLTKLEPKIRASYHKLLDFSIETLAWMIAIDASFLLEFLQVYAIEESASKLKGISSGMSHLVDYARQKSAHNMIVRDIVMLENQIPLFVLSKILEVQLSSIELAEDNTLRSVLAGFCAEISPIKIKQDYSTIQISQKSHLLDCLYEMSVGKTVVTPEIAEVVDNQNEEIQVTANSFSNASYVRGFITEFWKLTSKLNNGPVRLLKRLIYSRPTKLFLRLPYTFLSNIPGFWILMKQPVEYFFPAKEKEEAKSESADSSHANKPPLVEEITIPSVVALAKSGVRFSPTNGNILSISFDAKTVTLHLPVINLDGNTEVVLRNLVAYEASSASGPLIFTRYTELMYGIIDTEEDVKLLRKDGIIVNRLKSDREAANIWNGMSKSIRLTKVDFIDKVIEDVNKHYNGRWRVKIGKFVKIYVFKSWQFLTLIAAIALLLLMTLQAFCSVYNCARVFHIGTTI